MGKPVVYAGRGPWKVMVMVPEVVAKKILGILQERGCTCAELVRSAVTEYVERRMA